MGEGNRQLGLDGEEILEYTYMYVDAFGNREAGGFIEWPLG